MLEFLVHLGMFTSFLHVLARFVRDRPIASFGQGSGSLLWPSALIGHEEAVEQMGLAPKDLHRSDLAVFHLIFH